MNLMSTPLRSCSVQMGVMAARARETLSQREPAMLPESSMRKMVSKVARKAKRSSVVVLLVVVGVELVIGVRAGGCVWGAAV